MTCLNKSLTVLQYFVNFIDNLLGYTDNIRKEQIATKFLKGFGIAVSAIIIIVLLALGYLGFVPGVSDLFGSNKPRDLGVTYTLDDFQSARAKTGIGITDSPSTNLPSTELPSNTTSEQSLKLSNQGAANTTLTEAELNALLNNLQWKNYPLSDCQLRINPDGTVEFTGLLLKERLVGYGKTIGTTKDKLKFLTDYLRYLPGNLAFYIKGTVAVANGQIVNADITDFHIGNLSLTSEVKDHMDRLIHLAQTKMASSHNFYIKSLKLVSGQVEFEGTLPGAMRAKSQ
jgi:hypothetical protein